MGGLCGPSARPLIRLCLRHTGLDGQRISKTVGDPLNGGYKEYYLRDAQGNIMATYKYADNGTSLKVTDRPVYGSSRIGSFTRQMELMGEPAMHQWPYTQPMQAPLKRYELTDHLGNVATVVTGRLLPLLGPGVQYQAEVVSAQTLEPYGSLLPNRNWNSNAYKWGLNGQLKDDEVYGPTGTSTTAEFWQYDTRAVRRWNLDPEPQISISDYAAFTLSPILYNDPRGNSATKYETKDGRELLNTNDGKDIVVTVPDRLVKPMEHFAANNSKETLNSPEWNDNMTNTALKMGGTWDRSLGGKVKDALGVVGDMWKDPQMVVGGLSVGLGGMAALSNTVRSLRTLPAAENGAVQGTRLFRVWGDGAGANGRSWTTADPRGIANYRNAAGLPDQNTGRFLSEGILGNTSGVTTRSAVPLHGNAGGLPEVIVPNPSQQIQLQNVQGLNPPF